MSNRPYVITTHLEGQKWALYRDYEDHLSASEQAREKAEAERDALKCCGNCEHCGIDYGRSVECADGNDSHIDYELNTASPACPHWKAR
jgi:hypothetical protein